MAYDDKDPKEWASANIKAPIYEVPHTALSRYGDSMYKSICPSCRIGLLLVNRDKDTFELQEYDRCLLCGQQIRYTDIQDLRKKDKGL